MLRHIDGIKQLLLRFFFYSFSSDDISRVKDVIVSENLHYVRIWSFIESLYWGFCIVMSFFQYDYRICRNIYVVACIVCIIAFCLSWIKSNGRVHKAVVWSSALMTAVALLVAGVFIAINLAPKTIVIFAAPLIVPVMFISDTLWSIILLIMNILLFVLFGYRLSYETQAWVLTNQIIFSSVGIMLGHFVNRTRFERYAFAEAAIELADLRAQYAYHDDMTGLKNRRAYNEHVERLQDGCSDAWWVVMVDVNGLKEMNDTKGHKAGDELIMGTAECLRDSFDRIDSIYRLGGDEFCVIVEGADAYIDDCLSRLRVHGDAWAGDVVSGISLSYGSARINDYAVPSDAVKAADSRMYEAKREYYGATNHDRRRS